MKKQSTVILILIFITTNVVFSQQTNFRLAYEQAITINKVVNSLETPVNTGFKPILKKEIQKYINIDSVLYGYERETSFFKKHKKNWFYRKFLFENFIDVKTDDFNLSINPLLYLEKGNIENLPQKYSINTRGIEFQGSIGKKLSFYSNFFENQAFFRNYIDSIALERLVVPGQGASKTFNEKGHDFAMASGYLSFSPTKNINLQAGHDKHFVGEGYRSLLLSDNSFNYPFAKATINYKGFKYTALFTQFEDFTHVYYAYHTKKHGQFNYLSYSYKNIVELGFFEGIIYQTTDSVNLKKIPADFYIPVLGLQTVKYKFSNPNKVLIGLNLKVKATDYIQFYAQLASDDPKNKKNAYQIGIKFFDALYGKLNNHNLYLQAEYNTAKNDIYKNTERYTTWSHYNQDLTHPLGTNFNEFVFISRYNFKNFFVSFKYTDAETNQIFSDIFYLNDIDNKPDTKIKISHKTIFAGYIINPRYNFRIYAGADIREIDKIKEKYIFAGISTNISNFYYDF